VSDEGDAKILNEVQDRFDVNITELPDEIDLSSYSKLIGMDILSYTVSDLRSRTSWKVHWWLEFSTHVVNCICMHKGV
jgi:hypothetical protein